ncbi:hypothetical protein [Helicobacter sp. T3_23-1059]
MSIQKNINALKAYRNVESNKPEYSLYMELYGSINGSQYGYKISKETAGCLKAKYLGIGNICEYGFINSKENNDQT